MCRKTAIVVSWDASWDVSCTTLHLLPAREQATTHAMPCVLLPATDDAPPHAMASATDDLGCLFTWDVSPLGMPLHIWCILLAQKRTSLLHTRLPPAHAMSPRSIPRWGGMSSLAPASRGMISPLHTPWRQHVHVTLDVSPHGTSLHMVHGTCLTGARHDIPPPHTPGKKNQAYNQFWKGCIEWVLWVELDARTWPRPLQLFRWLCVLCCSVVQCVAVWCSVLQCVAECVAVRGVDALIPQMHFWRRILPAELMVPSVSASHTTVGASIRRQIPHTRHARRRVRGPFHRRKRVGGAEVTPGRTRCAIWVRAGTTRDTDRISQKVSSIIVLCSYSTFSSELALRKTIDKCHQSMAKGRELYGVAAISRLLKIIGLCCKRAQ